MTQRRPDQRRSGKVQKRARRRRLERARRGPQASIHAGGSETAEAQDLISTIGRAMDDPEPLALLALVSSLLSAVMPKRQPPFGPAGDDSETSHATLEEFVDSFLGVDIPQTTAALAVIAVLAEAGNELLSARIRRELARRVSPRPGWLRDLAAVTPYRTVEMVHVLGDGDDVMVALRLPTGHELTAMVYIDHNMGTLLKDAFFIPDSIEAVIALMSQQDDTEDTEFRDLDPADARTRIEEAAHLTEITHPPIETDSWPGCRPLVEWVCRLLPEGGRGYQRPEWSEEETRHLADDFFASPFGAPLDDRPHRELLDAILWFGTDYAPGDPMRWSPVAAEMLLGDWIPRKIVADVEFLSLAPDLLRAFVRYCHDVRGLREVHTTDTLEAIDRWTPGYLETIRSPRPQGVDPRALLASLVADRVERRKAPQSEPGASTRCRAAGRPGRATDGRSRRR